MPLVFAFRTTSLLGIPPQPPPPSKSQSPVTRMHAEIDQETWLKDAVLSVFPDTRDSSPSMIKFFGDEKRSLGSSKSKVSAKMNPALDQRPLSDFAFKGIGRGESLPSTNSTQHLGSAIKQLAPTNLQSSLLLGKNNIGGDVSEPSVHLKRNLGAYNNRSWEFWLADINMVGKITFVAVLGCILVFTFKLSGMNFKSTTASKWAKTKPRMNSTSFVCTTDPSQNCNVGPAYIRGSSITSRMKRLLTMVKRQFQKQSYPRKLKRTELAGDLSSSRKQMPGEEAEALVKHWQAIKADALGPSHEVHCLDEVLDGPMLDQSKVTAD